MEHDFQPNLVERNRKLVKWCSTCLQEGFEQRLGRAAKHRRRRLVRVPGQRVVELAVKIDQIAFVNGSRHGDSKVSRRGVVSSLPRQAMPRSSWFVPFDKG